MRFDDMIATVLAHSDAAPASLSAKWRQLVDLIAQRRGLGPSAELADACAWLAENRNAVPLAVRQDIARALTGRRVSPAIVRFFSEDHSSVASPLLAGVRLEPQEWVALLPSLSPLARSLLRHRRDLPSEVEQALASFGPSDFALSASSAAAAAAASSEAAAPPEPASGAAADAALTAGEGQIRELVERIEAFRRERGDLGTPAAAAAAEATTRAEAFQWETGPDGVVIWVEGAPRGPLIGQTIAAVAEHGQYGVDGQAAGAFDKRAPFRDARFTVPGAGAASGDWRISGVPFFDPARGNFLGYRGTARRPRLDEVARPEAASEGQGLFGSDMPPDSLRQLIHELRTPLNAIVGFAEMIDGQYMGPAAASYRSRAHDIMEQARRLLSAVDDLDTAARIETRRLTLDEAPVDAVALLCRLHDAYERVAGQRGSRIAIEIAQNLPAARVELGAAERMFARMLAATIGLAAPGETIAATMAMGAFGGQKMLCLSIDRPRAIAGLDEASLLDPGYSPEGDWPGAPALGLGFALRLVRNLADAVGGALSIGETRFFLYLPAVDGAELSSGRSG